jgi:hypothetical protein
MCAVSSYFRNLVPISRTTGLLRKNYVLCHYIDRYINLRELSDYREGIHSYKEHYCHIITPNFKKNSLKYKSYISYPMGTGGYSSGDKAARGREANH